jgi:hypothetical protein
LFTRCCTFWVVWVCKVSSTAVLLILCGWCDNYRTLVDYVTIIEYLWMMWQLWNTCGWCDNYRILSAKWKQQLRISGLIMCRSKITFQDNWTDKYVY